MTPTTPGASASSKASRSDDRERFVDQQRVVSYETGLTVERPSPQQDRDRVLRRPSRDGSGGPCRIFRPRLRI